MLDVAIAFVVFNRPESTRLSFERIRAARPSKLFLISDAPRTDCEGEATLVEQSRHIAEQVDWPCEVRKIYSDENLGCGRRISSGITAAFGEVERLIILEDDCVADPTFFGFCDQLLDHYRDDQRIMAVSGNNFQQGIRRTDASYYFSKYPHCWGWATWRRAWQHFQLDMPLWPQFRDAGHLASICSSQIEIDYWIKMFNRAYNKEVNSWAFPWTLSCWMQHGLAVIPEVNLVKNIGFGVRATHTRNDDDVGAQVPTQSLNTMVHPDLVVRHVEADAFTDDQVFSRHSRENRLIRRVSRSFPRVYCAA